jgi:hypothetical protein
MLKPAFVTAFIGLCLTLLAGALFAQSAKSVPAGQTFPNTIRAQPVYLNLSAPKVYAAEKVGGNQV